MAGNRDYRTKLLKKCAGFSAACLLQGGLLAFGIWWVSGAAEASRPATVGTNESSSTPATPDSPSARNLAESLRPTSSPSQSARKRALLVGIASYSRNMDPDDMRYAAEGAVNLAHAFEWSERTHTRWLLEKMSTDDRDDVAAFYFAGHGSQVLNLASNEPGKMTENLGPAGSYQGANDGRLEALGLREIQTEVLDLDTLLLEYSLGEDRSFLWAVSSTSIYEYELPSRAVIEAAANQVYDLLARSYARATKVPLTIALARLSDMVLRPAADRLDVKKLAVVSDGALHLVPFAALPDPRVRSGDLEPLATSHEIVYLPSASALRWLRDRAERRVAAGRTATKEITVLADPVFSKNDPRAPRASSPASSLRRLSSTGEEAQSILALVPSGEGHAALGFAASRQAVLDKGLEDYRIIHLATHGLAASQGPELSGLVLSSIDETGRPQQDVLRASDVRRLNLIADLVVLSACKTALDTQEEATPTLAQSFLEAGASRVLVSHWDVSDRATARFMRDFYRSMLGEGLSPAAALRQAQASMRSEPPWSSPYYWAGFSLQGDWR